MIPCSQKVMTEDEKGKKFLELIDEQNNLQWSMISKLTALVKSEWNSIAIKHDLELLIAQHSEITRKLNSMEENSLL
jgi:hypothetical protein